MKTTTYNPVDFYEHAIYAPGFLLKITGYSIAYYIQPNLLKISYNMAVFSVKPNYLLNKIWIV
jgi:hypothetical protein